MKIISWNICCLPNMVNLYQNPRKVIDGIINIIDKVKPDFICLQEVFDITAINCLKEHFSNYNIIYSRTTRGNFVNSGLMILSKHTLVDSGYHEFKDKCGEDRLASKGFMYGIYKLGNRLTTIYNCHLNNDKPLMNLFSNPYNVIEKQLTQLMLHTHKTINMVGSVIICGDFNTDTYYIKNFLDGCYITQNLHVYGINYTPTVNGENRVIDHILYISINKNTRYRETTKVLNYACFSDHCMICKEIEV